jgi:hypothetical protein
VAALAIDEVSFLDTEAIGHLCERNRALGDAANRPFGGRPTILVHDNHQKPPVSGASWFRELVFDAVARDEAV